MASTVEWALHPDLGRIAMNQSIQRLPSNKQGLAHDSFWKLRNRDVHGENFEVPSDTRWDGTWVPTGQIADTKLKMPKKQYVYLSERERRVHERQNCIYPIFQWALDGYSTELLCVFDYVTAAQAGAIHPFEGGSWVWCEELGRAAAPSSINLRRLLRHPGVLWLGDPR